jgi:serine/threonine-protein kinase
MSASKAGDSRLLDQILGVDPPAFEEDDATVVIPREAGATDDPTPPPVTDPTPNSAELPLTEPVDVRAGLVVDGRYRVERLIGRGGIGLVYLCHHEVLEKPVAMKVLRPEYAELPEVIERFVNEARAASAIKSDHIVNTLDVGSLASGAPYFIMEHVDAQTLAAILERDHALPIGDAVEVARQMADGLGAAHAAGIVHRDLKPENVFLGRTDDGGIAVKIFDFGVAKVSRAKNRLTHVGAIFGTPSYMSPEQARGQTVDPRADIYAIGIMLYEMIAGHLPFDGEDPLAVMAKHVDAEVPPLTRTPFGTPVPAAIEAVVRRCLEKQRDRRYPTVVELLADLGPPGTLPQSARREPLEPELLRDSQLPQVVVPLEELAVKAAPPVAPAAPAAASSARVPEPGPWRNWMLLAAGIAGIAALVWFAFPRDGVRDRLATSLLAEPAAAPSASPPKARAQREVHLVLSPLDAQVFLGEQNLGQMPVSVNVDDGKPLVVSVRRKGYRTRRVVLDGTQTRVVVGLNKLPGGSK